MLSIMLSIISTKYALIEQETMEPGFHYRGKKINVLTVCVGSLKHVLYGEFTVREVPLYFPLGIPLGGLHHCNQTLFSYTIPAFFLIGSSST